MAQEAKQSERGRAPRTLRVVSAWALAVGCVVGWGSFVMPGSTFLPTAGPVGACLGILVALVAVCIVAANYSYLFRACPQESGPYGFIKRILGDDHAFLAAWALALAYLSLLWANATAFVLIGRYVFGDVLQWGAHYTLAGYDIYLGEVLATIAIQTAFGLLSCFAERVARVLRTVLAVGMVVAVAAMFAVATGYSGAETMTTPPFALGEAPTMQVASVAILAPWLFVGFESVYQGARGSGLSGAVVGRAAMAAALTGALIYMAFVLIGASGSPAAYANWMDYTAALGNLSGVEGMPVLYNMHAALGPAGVRLAAIALLCILSTSVLGFYRVASQVIQTMSLDGLLPAWLGSERGGVARNALLLIMVISLPIPFLGRTAVGWNADVSTLTVAIVYAYISLAALRSGVRDGSTGAKVTGIAGLMISVVIFFFLLAPNLLFYSALATESYFILAAWSLVGILYYWYVFSRDHEMRFGKSTVMWIMMLFLLLFAVIAWSRLSAQSAIAQATGMPSVEVAGILASGSLLQIAVVGIALLIMLSLFSTMLKRQKELDLKAVQAEQSNKAKTSFLSNMSHDIRTPMNAIIGLTELAMHSTDDAEKTREYLEKVKASSDHLLSLINDVLEMSRIESGKIELDLEPVNLPQVMADLETIVTGQAQAKNQTLEVVVQDLQDPDVMCDKLRLNQVLLNLVGNAVKYTPDGGDIRVSVVQSGEKTVGQTGEQGEGVAAYEIRVADNGIGMTPEFAARVFEAFEREKSSTVNAIQGTGLGMAITKRIVDQMGGTIEVDTELGKGTEFVVKVELQVCESAEASGAQAAASDEMSFVGRRILLADDVEMNREIASTMLEMYGFEIDEAENGQEALDAIKNAEPGYYDAVLMDVHMPVMGGYDATRAIRALGDDRATVPIFAVTANAFEEDRRASTEAGMNGHIPKPIEFDKLVEELARVISA